MNTYFIVFLGYSVSGMQVGNSEIKVKGELDTFEAIQNVQNTFVKGSDFHKLIILNIIKLKQNEPKQGKKSDIQRSTGSGRDRRNSVPSTGKLRK